LYEVICRIMSVLSMNVFGESLSSSEDRVRRLPPVR